MTTDAMPTPIDGQLDRRSDAVTEPDVNAIAWRFFASEFAGLRYASWPVERRVDAYLTRHGMRRLVNDGDAYDTVLTQILTNVGPALRSGLLANTTWLTTRRHSPDDRSDAYVDAPKRLRA